MKSNLKAFGMTVALVFGAMHILGCDSGSGGSGSSGTVNLSQFPAAYAQALCSQNFKCAPASDIGTHTMQQCVDDASTGLSLFAQLISGSQASNRVSYDPVKMGMCITAVNQMTCNDWKNGLSATNQPDACKAAIAPKVAAGGACQQDLECMTQHCEGADSGPVPPVDGMCTALPVAGASCSGGVSCADGLYCDGASQKCVAQKPAGQTCTSDEQCVNACNLTTGTSVCSAYVGCAAGGSAPRASTLSLVMVGMMLLLVGRGRGRGRAPRSRSGSIRE